MELILSLAKENAGADKQTLVSNLAAAYTTLQARAEEIKSNGIGQMSSAARQSLANLEEKQRQLLEALGHELEDVERESEQAGKAYGELGGIVEDAVEKGQAAWEGAEAALVKAKGDISGKTQKHKAALRALIEQALLKTQDDLSSGKANSERSAREKEKELGHLLHAFGDDIADDSKKLCLF